MHFNILYQATGIFSVSDIHLRYHYGLQLLRYSHKKASCRYIKHQQTAVREQRERKTSHKNSACQKEQRLILFFDEN